MTSLSAHFLIASIFIAIGHCDDFSNAQKGKEPPRFDSHPAKAVLQSWSEWLEKRGLGGAAGLGSGLDSSAGHFQQWQEWMKKRGLTGNTPPQGFGQFGQTDLQQWKDWYKKRGSPGNSPPKGFGQFGQTDMQQWRDWYKKRGLKNPFPAFGENGQLQHWNDWMAKRGFDVSSGLFGHQGSNDKFQTWSEFTKRGHFDPPSSEFGSLGSDQLQHWNDWMKRQYQMDNKFGPAFGDKTYLMKWDDYFKRGAVKRQLGYVPNGFGSFSRYFTDGLQDWRSTYQGAKRSKPEKQDKQ